MSRELCRSTHGNATWTARQIDDLCAYRGEGMSFTKIAPIVGCSKNAAIGKFNRLRDEGYGPALAFQAALSLSDQTAEWMAENGGTVGQCAKALNADRHVIETAWRRIRQRLGPKAV